MNKTSRRATQKHRAKAQNYALRRKAEGGTQVAGASRSKSQATGTATPAPRPKSAPKRRAEKAESGETTASDNE